MIKIRGLIFVFLFALSFSYLFVTVIKAENVGCGANDLTCYSQKINEYQEKIKLLGQQSNTLSNQIAQFDAQIKLTSLKIAQVEEKITLLGGRINQLEGSLNTLSGAFSSRAVETYKMTRLGEPFLLLISASDLTQAASRFHYLEKIQEADRDLLQRLQIAQTTYKDEKSNQESLQNELQIQKKNLDTQKSAKAYLLTVTKNDEKKYQQLLAQARAEYEAIQSIIAGQGQENQVGQVSEGQRIASVIPSSSPCSSGEHLHFEVVKDGGNQNPANFLIPKSVIWDDGPDGPFSFSGSWQWPLGDPVRITQVYGMSYYARVLKYYGGAPHSGIDILNDNHDLSVKAVKGGTLYRGAIACGGGTLRYVHVSHSEGGFNTYYLHVNY
jgi:peptidoglycan hydrolase CwlO-like protein